VIAEEINLAVIEVLSAFEINVPALYSYAHDPRYWPQVGWFVNSSDSSISDYSPRRNLFPLSFMTAMRLSNHSFLARYGTEPGMRVF
jgi:hypothetical protein